MCTENYKWLFASDLCLYGVILITVTLDLTMQLFMWMVVTQSTTVRVHTVIDPKNSRTYPGPFKGILCIFPGNFLAQFKELRTTLLPIAKKNLTEISEKFHIFVTQVKFQSFSRHRYESQGFPGPGKPIKFQDFFLGFPGLYAPWTAHR